MNYSPDTLPFSGSAAPSSGTRNQRSLDEAVTELREVVSTIKIQCHSASSADQAGKKLMWLIDEITVKYVEFWRSLVQLPQQSKSPHRSSSSSSGPVSAHMSPEDGVPPRRSNHANDEQYGGSAAPAQLSADPRVLKFQEAVGLLVDACTELHACQYEWSQRQNESMRDGAINDIVQKINVSLYNARHEIIRLLHLMGPQPKLYQLAAIAEAKLEELGTTIDKQEKSRSSAGCVVM